MSDEHLQKELKVSSYSDTHLTPENTVGIPGLILSAYLDDKKRWEDELQEASEAMAEKVKEMTEVRTLILNQSKIKTFLSKTFKIKTKNEKRLLQVMKEVEDLKGQFVGITSSPPSPNAYELAIMGNNLFKAR